MKRANIIATACFTALIGALTPMNAHAQDFIGLEKSILTFSGPVELPGLTLQPGTYVFQRPDPNSARIIEVFTADKKDILGTFLTIPSKRLEVTSHNVVTFRESREGMTPAVQYWYYPGLETGHEFLYSKEQAMKIAARTGQAVMTADGRISPSDATPVATTGTVDLNASAPATDAQGIDSAANANENANADASLSAQNDNDAAAADVNVNRQSSASTAQPEPDSQVAANQDSSDRMPRETVGTSGQADANNAPTDRLPSTASPLAVYGLIGLLSLAGAASLRRVRA